MSDEGRSIYKPLTDRRIYLLRMAAGRRGDPITSLLLPVSLDELPSYAALSYTWGDPKPTHSIICNDTTVNITKNLHDALLRLRSTDEACLVWADAICIDQSNVVERGQQVRLMQSIYASATITIVNLGEPGEKGARAVALGIHIIELSKILPPNYRVSVANLESFGLPPDGSAAWNPLNEFFQNPWFQRAWITQEFAVSPRLAMTYGDQTLLADFAGKCEQLSFNMA
jgi:hypothetical protein